ncbi:hypothetical protein BDN70DRAFT_662340 [Pholiota conissans]|uniref:Uncharacterized protein n=1 Tax=Pholiota conissans TaxID=109636 RepID=A0A9P5Z443_9AGAR|nr:hypothetical protein BDN70DRAFT_662340 [Pholiota conissans]
MAPKTVDSKCITDSVAFILILIVPTSVISVRSESFSTVARDLITRLPRRTFGCIEQTGMYYDAERMKATSQMRPDHPPHVEFRTDLEI